MFPQLFLKLSLFYLATALYISSHLFSRYFLFYFPHNFPQLSTAFHNFPHLFFKTTLFHLAIAFTALNRFLQLSSTFHMPFLEISYFISPKAFPSFSPIYNFFMLPQPSTSFHSFPNFPQLFSRSIFSKSILFHFSPKLSTAFHSFPEFPS